METTRQYSGHPIVAPLAWAIRSILVQQGARDLRPFGI